MNVRENVPASELSTMRVGGTIPRVVSIRSAADAQRALEMTNELGLTFVPLGGGSNVVFGDGTLPYLVGLIEVPGIEYREHHSHQLVTCGAGVPWDELVAHTIERGLSGLELLSAIPGTVGGAPIQNIGAYGAEFADTCESVEIFDPATREVRLLNRASCGFSYRSSIFKREPGAVVLRVTLRLHAAEHVPIPSHPEVAAALQHTPATPAAIREAVRSIRARKLPDPAITPNCGSFFTNPIVDETTAARIRAEFPDMPAYPAETGTKLSAGWLIERAGYKGISRNGAGTHERHALVLINHGTATGVSVRALAQEIAEAVFDRFGVSLVPEANLLPRYSVPASPSSSIS